jgi:hypothetical protein
MSMITPDRLLQACRLYEQDYGTAPRYLYVSWFDWEPLRYLLRDSLDEQGRLHVGRWRLTFMLHQTIKRGQCCVTDKAIPAEYRPTDRKTVHAETTVAYPGARSHHSKE